MPTRRGVEAGRAFVVIEALDRTGKVLNRISRRLDAFSQRAIALGRQLGIVGGLLALPFASSIKEARAYSDAMLALDAKLRTVGNRIEATDRLILDLAETTTFTASEIARAANELAKADFDVNQIEAALPGLLDFAKAGELDDLPGAALAMADSIKAFGLEASNSAHVGDMFFVAATNGTTSVKELTQALSFSAGSANQLGFGLAKTLGILSQTSKAMLKSTKGGTSLNQFLLQLASNAEKIEDTLGVKVTDEIGNFRDRFEILSEIVDSINSMADAPKFKVLKELFNVRGTRQAVAIAQMFEDIEKVTAEIEGSAGRAAVARQKMESGLGGTIDKLISKVVSLKIKVGNALTPAFQAFDKAVSPVIRGLSRFISENEEIVVKVAKGIGILLGSAVAFILIGVGLKVLSISFAVLASAIHLLFTPFILLKLLFITLPGLLFGVAKAAIVATVALLKMAVVAGIAVVKAMVLATTSVIGFMASLVSSVVATVGPLLLFSLLIGVIAAGVLAIGDFARKGPEEFRKFVVAMSTHLKSLKKIFSSTINFVGPAISELARGVSGGVISHFKAIPKAFVSLFGNVPKFFQKVFGDIFSIVKETFDAIVLRIQAGDIEGAMTIAMAGLKMVWFKVINSLKETWLRFTTSMKQIFIGATVIIGTKWRETQKSIASGILDLASENDFFNSVFKKFSGVDVKAEIERGKQLGSARIEAKKKAIDDINALEASGTLTAEEAAKKRADIQASIEEDQDPLGEAKRQAEAPFTRAIKELERQGAKDLEDLDKTFREEMKKLRDAEEKARKSFEKSLAAPIRKFEVPEVDAGTGITDAIKNAVDGLTDLGGDVTKLPSALEQGSVEAARQEFLNRAQNEQLQTLKSIADSSKEIAKNTEDLEAEKSFMSLWDSDELELLGI